MAETTIEKAQRILTDGRLTVERVEGDLVVASCAGDSGTVYHLGFDPRTKGWRCTCPARKRCAHLEALMLVILRWSDDG